VRLSPAPALPTGRRPGCGPTHRESTPDPRRPSQVQKAPANALPTTTEQPVHSGAGCKTRASRLCQRGCACSTRHPGWALPYANESVATPAAQRQGSRSGELQPAPGNDDLHNACASLADPVSQATASKRGEAGWAPWQKGVDPPPPVWWRHGAAMAARRRGKPHNLLRTLPHNRDTPATWACHPGCYSGSSRGGTSGTHVGAEPGESEESPRFLYGPEARPQQPLAPSAAADQAKPIQHRIRTAGSRWQE